MLSIPRGTDFVEARNLIDEEQRNCENRLLLLKRQRNTFTDVAKLPDEVLLEIFMVVRKDTEADLWYHVTVVVTHVCRHWRWLAIQAPQLWTRPPTHLHDLTLLFLDQSKPLGLDVIFSARTSEDTVIAVSRNMQRIQTLVVGDVDYLLLAQMQESLLDLDHEASMLKTLHISPKHSHQCRFKLSASTFGRPLLLQTLTIQSIDFEWAMLPLPNLTSLSLRFMQGSNPSGPSWESLFHTLSAMPLLKKIRLSSRQLRLHTLSRNINPFTLSNLTSLHITFPSEMEILAFISTVAMPVLERIDMCCDTLEDRDDHSTAVRVISPMIEQGNFGTLDNLDLDECTLTLSTFSESPEKYVTFSHLGTMTEHRTVTFATQLLSGISALIRDGVLTLRHAILGSYPAPSSVETFAALPLLESITMWDDTIIPFLDGLSIPMFAMEDTRIPFPSLKSITFLQEEYSVHESVFCSELFDRLYDCLMQRCHYNAPIDNLSIPWIISEKEFRSLKEVVVNVDFNDCGGVGE